MHVTPRQSALLDSGQYEQALEAWRAVQQIDPAYPDARKIEATASKKLKELAQPAGRKTSIKLGKFEWGILGICLAALLLGGGVGIYNAFFAPPAQTCTIPKDECRRDHQQQSALFGHLGWQSSHPRKNGAMQPAWISIMYRVGRVQRSLASAGTSKMTRNGFT